MPGFLANFGAAVLGKTPPPLRYWVSRSAASGQPTKTTAPGAAPPTRIRPIRGRDVPEGAHLAHRIRDAQLVAREMSQDDGYPTRRALLEHLSTQHRQYRDEFRAWVGFAAASAAVLVAGLGAIFALSKDMPSYLIAVSPLVLVSYSALVGVLLMYAAAAQLYSELLERKMNALLGREEYTFELQYSVFRGVKADQRPYLMLFGVMTLAPLVIGAAGLYQMLLMQSFSNVWSLTCVLFLALSVTAAVGGVLILVRQAALRRQAINQEVLKDWIAPVSAPTIPGQADPD
jgi:hypothetical protein